MSPSSAATSSGTWECCRKSLSSPTIAFSAFTSAPCFGRATWVGTMERLQLGSVRDCLLLSHPDCLQLEIPIPKEHEGSPIRHLSPQEFWKYPLTAFLTSSRNLTALKMAFPPSLCIPDISFSHKSYMWVVAQPLHPLLLLCWVFHPQQAEFSLLSCPSPSSAHRASPPLMVFLVVVYVISNKSF